MIPEERLAQRVGAIALVVLAAAIAGAVFLLDGASLGAPTRIRVAFHHVAGLRERAALVVAGQPVGRIEAVVPLPHGRGGVLGGEVGVAVTIAIAAGDAWKVPANAEIFVASRGPLGDKYLEVAPPQGTPGPAVHDGLELRGVDPPSLDTVLQRSWANMTTFKLFADAVRPEVAALRAQVDELRRQIDALAPGTPAGLGALAVAVRDASAAARHAYTSSLGGEAGLAHAAATLRATRAALGELRAALDALGPRAAAIASHVARVRDHVASHDPGARVAQTLAAVRDAIARLDPLLATAGELADRAARGEGSLGRLMADPEFSDDAKDLGKIIKRHPWRVLERPAD